MAIKLQENVEHGCSEMSEEALTGKVVASQGKLPPRSA